MEKALLQEQWGLVHFIGGLQRDLPHLAISRNRSARYFALAKVLLLEYWALRLAHPAPSRAFLLKIHLLVLIYDTQNQTEVLRELFTAYALDFSEEQGTLVRRAFQDCTALLATRLVQQFPWSNRVKRQDGARLIIDLGRVQTIEKHALLEVFNGREESLGLAIVGEVRSTECVAFLLSPGADQASSARLIYQPRQKILTEEDAFLQFTLGHQTVVAEKTPLAPALPVRVAVLHRCGPQWQETQLLASGELYQIRLDVLEEVYLYGFQRDSAGAVKPIFPHPAPGTGLAYSFLNPISPDTYFIPSSTTAFRLDSTRGEEHFYFRYSASPLDMDVLRKSPCPDAKTVVVRVEHR